MNQGMYGYGLPPNYATGVAPSKWTNGVIFPTAGTYSFVVPQNVFQIAVAVWGAGGSGGNCNTTTYQAAGGGGGGFLRNFRCYSQSNPTNIDRWCWWYCTSFCKYKR